MSQPIFNHPELVVQTIPQKKWFAFRAVPSSSDDNKTFVYYNTYGVSNMRRTVVLDQNANKLEERFHTGLSFTKLFAKITHCSGEDDTLEEFFFEDCEVVCYQRINGKNTLCEQWLNKRGGEIALRHTQNGVLTRDSLEEPAVSIRRPHNLRREYWKDGVLQKVCLVDRKTGEEIMRQLWVDGKCTSQVIHPTRQNEILEKDLALPLETPKPEPPVVETPEPVFKIISAQEAREEFENDDEKIQKVLDDFDARRRAGISQGTRTLDLRVDAKLEVKVAEVLQKAGYIVKRSWMTLSSNDGRVPLVVSY